MNAEELEALPVLSVVLDLDGDAWQKKEPGRWYLAPEREWNFDIVRSAELAKIGPLIPLTAATDSGTERLAALRKAVTG